MAPQQSEAMRRTVGEVLLCMEDDLALLVYRLNLDGEHSHALRAQEALQRVSTFHIDLKEFADWAWEDDPQKLREKAEMLNE